MSIHLPRQIAAAFEPILGRPAWQVKKGYGSFLTLEFGEPHLDIGKPRLIRGRNHRRVTVYGDWHLWIFCCDWKITQSGNCLAHSESDDEAIAKSTAQLDGQCLKKIRMEPGTVICHFEFDLGAVLTTFPYDDEDDEPDEQWILYEPSGMVLMVRSDHQYAHVHKDVPGDEEAWLPLLSNRE